ncbi:tyrosine-type recombinase/integrase [Cellvibrio sp. QJXJ]|uniref:tyrosine-type recombinase/integrase n=1 Tax=Cellvibrio sp. QJXJ TaxID=2964606 RepID=UPI0021C3836E|nr:tyrosine-type recombinase/integrase [Cellvibrio sp. QJXJ]UUA75215.1 tyrosine-type recombinase/integrase [Cellvibrio sp. QJXJ]
MTAEIENLEKGKSRLKYRADFQPAEKVYSHTPMRPSGGHCQKIQRYRLAMLESMKGRVSPETFALFFERSHDLNTVLPENSEIALYSDFAQYLKFSSGGENEFLPVSDFALIAYIDNLQGLKRSKSTIERHVASIVWWCTYLELDDPRRLYRVKLKLKKMRAGSNLGTGQTQALRYEHLEAALGVFDPAIPRDYQDMTLLFTAFETMCRRSELVELRWQHFELQADGTGLMFIESSKTDQRRRGEYLFLSRNTADLLIGWRNLSVESGGEGAAYIFRGIYSNGMLGDQLNPGAVNRAFKRIARKLGLDETIFSGHSTRVGAAQEMLERNINAAKIMKAGRWRSMEMVTHYAAKINPRSGGMADLTNLIANEKRAQKGNYQIAKDFDLLENVHIDSKNVISQ